jgi:hypothetical protein
VAIEAARIGHQHAQETGAPAGTGAQIPDVERTQGAGLSSIPKPRRGRPAVPIIDGEGHQDAELFLQIGNRHSGLL